MLGRCLVAQRDDVHAEQSFKTALHQMPGLVPAHHALARLYERRGDKGLAAGHRIQARELLKSRKEPRRVKASLPVAASVPDVPFEERSPSSPASQSDVITIVAGLPRSGTSMLMQLLAAGGIEPLTDGLRAPDSDNPRGYLEYEPATRLAQDASWLPLARGKVVKLALPLLPYLPEGEAYRILVIERDTQDVIASQRAMLKRLGRAGTSLGDAALAAEYRRQRERVVRWLSMCPEVAVLPLQYEEVLADPSGTGRRIASFWGDPFDHSAAAEAIDPTLRRQTAAAGAST